MNAPTASNPSTRARPRLALIAGLTLTALTLGGVALARPPGGGFGGFGPGRALMRALGDLELTEQQEVKVVRMRRNLHEQAKGAQQEMRGSASKLADELEKPTPDAQRLHGMVDDAMQRMTKMAHGAIDQLLELHSTFSPEQRARLADHLRHLPAPGEGEERRGPAPDDGRRGPERRGQPEKPRGR